jgi:ribosomal protein S3
MTKAQAEAITREVQELCERHKVWLDVNRVYKPELKDIVLTISVRVTEPEKR